MRLLLHRVGAFLLFIFSTSGLHGQDLYNDSSTLRYIHILKSQREFTLAYEEIKQLEMSDLYRNDSIQLMKMEVLWRLQNKEELTKGIYQYASSVSSTDRVLFAAINYCCLMDSLDLVGQLLGKIKDSTSVLMGEYKMIWLLEQHRVDEANDYLLKHSFSIEDRHFFEEMIQASYTAKSKEKSKAIAVVSSCLIPASGKYYAKQPFDATVGLVLSSVYGILAISSFNIAGPTSVFGWVNASAFLVVYSANIVGSARAVSRYNTKQFEKVNQGLDYRIQSLSGHFVL